MLVDPRRFFDPDPQGSDGLPMASDERAGLRGTVLESRYRVGACIGVGGTGVVFEAEDEWTGRTVVLKTMRPVFAYNASLVRRLRREAEVARRVVHPGIVPVLGEGILPDSSPFLVLERLRGESLNRMLRRHGTLSSADTAVIALRVAAILHRAHNLGYVHRDVKPEHVMLDRGPNGELLVSLLDFGVCASDLASQEEKSQERGRVFGTPSYVSPEQAAGDPDVDARADLYGLGATMYECLTGDVPFTASSVTGLLRRIIREEPPHVRRLAPHVDPAVDSLVARSMARARQDRFPNARAFGRAIAPFVQGRLGLERDLAGRLRTGTDHPDGLSTVREELAVA